MIINFIPQCSNVNTTISLNNNVLTYNNEDIDLSQFENGSTAENEFVIIDKDLDGNTKISLLWQYIEENDINSFPMDLEVTGDGEIKPLQSTKE